MENRFKFRAFYQGIFIYKSIDDANYYTKDGKCVALANTLPNTLIWEQCTGLTDKNGKLIYEGDILTDKIFNYEVVWDNNSGHFGLKALDSIFDIYNETRCAVIGNIHENKELLNE